MSGQPSSSIDAAAASEQAGSIFAFQSDTTPTAELFRLLGSGVIGDFGPLPLVQLAVIPGPHVSPCSRKPTY